MFSLIRKQCVNIHLIIISKDPLMDKKLEKKKFTDQLLSFSLIVIINDSYQSQIKDLKYKLCFLGYFIF